MSPDLMTPSLAGIARQIVEDAAGWCVTEACRLSTQCANRHAVSGSREDSHALHTPLKPEDTVVHQPVPRGWVTVHSQATMHGSGCASER